MKKKLPAIFTVIGISCLITASFLYWQRTTPRRLSFNIAETQFASGDINGNLSPQTLIIEGLSIKLPIFPARVEKGNWEASTIGVSHLSSSPIPGEIGNSVIYGHNWPNLLGNLTDIKPGQEINVSYNDGSKAKFVVRFTEVVTPLQTEVLSSSSDKRITLYTCTGFLDSKRFVVTATLEQE